MAQGKIARRWWLLAALLGLGVAFAIATLLLGSRSVPATVALPPNVLALTGLQASSVHAPELGMAIEITDGLDSGYLPGSTIARTLQTARLPLLRFGDVAADSYAWESDCTYANDGRFPECGVGAGNGSSFDHFLQFARTVGARPLIVVNGEIDDPQQAARMVSYYEAHCVRALSAGTPEGPCLQPYWEIGFSPATWRHFAIPLSERRPTDASVIQPDQYAALVVSYTAAMQRAVPPGITLQIVADEWITGATDQSWIATVSHGAIDTHYAPLLSVPGGTRPGADKILSSLTNGYEGRPGIDTWLQDLRSSLAQFSNSDGVAIMVGQWSIDANNSLTEPPIYGGYIQAVFAGALMVHLWQDAAINTTNPLLAAIQYPIIGSSQEPFDPASGQSRSVVALYSMIDHYFVGAPAATQGGSSVRSEGVIAAAALNGTGMRSYLLVNTNGSSQASVQLQTIARDRIQMWWISPNGQSSNAALVMHHTTVTGGNIVLAPWEVAVVQMRSLGD